jgi:hypothetical protein
MSCRSGRHLVRRASWGLAIFVGALASSSCSSDDGATRHAPLQFPPYVQASESTVLPGQRIAIMVSEPELRATDYTIYGPTRDSMRWLALYYGSGQTSSAWKTQSQLTSMGNVTDPGVSHITLPGSLLPGVIALCAGESACVRLTIA